MGKIDDLFFTGDVKIGCKDCRYALINAGIFKGCVGGYPCPQEWWSRDGYGPRCESYISRTSGICNLSLTCSTCAHYQAGIYGGCSIGRGPPVVSWNNYVQYENRYDCMINGRIIEERRRKKEKESQMGFLEFIGYSFTEGLRFGSKRKPR